MTETEKVSLFARSRNSMLDFIQHQYTQKRVAAGTANEKSTSAIVFSNLKELGFIQGLSESARDLKQLYDDNLYNLPEEDAEPLPRAMAWVALSVGAVQIMLTIAGYKNIDHAGHWEGFLPLSDD